MSGCDRLSFLTVVSALGVIGIFSGFNARSANAAVSDAGGVEPSNQAGASDNGGKSGSNATIRKDALFFTPLPPLPAGSRSPSPDPHDLAGIYYSAVGNTALPNGPGSAAGGAPPPYTSNAARYVQHAAEMEAKGEPLAGLEGLCRPTVEVRGSYIPGMIVQSPDEIVIVGELGRKVWQIHLNRDHPKLLTPTYLGDSVGHWEGDTLVVDTMGYNGKDALISTQQHAVTRIRKIDHGWKLEMKFKIADPLIYTDAVAMTSVLDWRPDYSILEDQCEENPQGAIEGQTLK
jgi:hypothetical protein